MKYVSGPDFPGTTREDLHPHEGIMEDLMSQLVEQGPHHEMMMEQDQPKHALQDVSYQAPGPYPFVCSHCEHFKWIVGEPAYGDCEVVDGPHAGKVGPEDACILFEVGPVLIGKHDTPEAED